VTVLAAARDRFEDDWARFPDTHKALTGAVPYPVERSATLAALAKELWADSG
jgi:hypothetical protein